MENPSNYSNWVIVDDNNKNVLIQGAYPHVKRKKRKEHLDLLLQLNINVFVNLCEPHERNINENYEKYINFICESQHQQHPKYYQCPILDMDVTSEFELDIIVNKIVCEFQNGDGARIYVHCKGGHGRSSMVLSCVIMKLFNNYNAEWAILTIKEKHDTRTVRPHLFMNEKQISEVQKYASRHLSSSE